ncbi:efhand_2 [Nesidiocoris tenuis]|uniref:Efhand_2 n=1 Tax=Nesidiocoris tenuis TaxID=355587 RepID=A0ABN7AEB0_9HEMI|nr:efhand_2 [Nesidiocoris tenuis]
MFTVMSHQEIGLIKSFREIDALTLACNDIKYAAYRTAAKLRIWQKHLEFDNVSLSVVRNVFSLHHILVTDTNVVLSLDELDSLLNDVLFSTSKICGHSFNVEAVSALTSIFLQRVFKCNEGISVLDVKVGLVCLCTAPLSEKYCYLFSQLADHNLCLARRKVKRLLESLIRIPLFLGEQNSFNESYIESTLDSCFCKSSELGVSESEFICWIVREPQLLIWLSTLYRFQVSEQVYHNVRCAVCYTKPIKGLRYICMRCLSYDLCQNCFFTGKKSKRHLAHHEIREFCAKASPCETVLLYFKGLLGRVFGGGTKLQYLPAVASDYLPDSGSSFSTANAHTVVPSQQPQEAIHIQKPEEDFNTIIQRIEQETRAFAAAAKGYEVTKMIEQHTSFLNQQLNCLRSLKADLDHKRETIFMSTPIAPANGNLEFLRSPLLLDDETTWNLPSPSGFSTWQSPFDPTPGEPSNSLKLQQDLDMIMVKLNDLIDQGYDAETDEETLTKL